jgi:RES domain-containing protein
MNVRPAYESGRGLRPQPHSKTLPRGSGRHQREVVLPAKENVLKQDARHVMSIKLHPDSDELSRAIQRLARNGRPFSGVCYRCTEPQFADQIITGLGSQLHGARWTPKNSFPTVYLCETTEAALQEYLARGRRLRLPDDEALPMLMAWIRVKAANLLDTTEPQIAAVIDPLLAMDTMHWRAIQDRREAVSQAIGRAIQEVCFSGLIAPSQVSPGSRIIVIFPKKLKTPDMMSAPRLKPMG